MCVCVSYFASALTDMTDDFNQIIYYRTRHTRLRLIETKIFLINYKATPAAQQQHSVSSSSSGISKNLLFSYDLHRQSQRRRWHRLTNATRLGSAPALGSTQSALSLSLSGFVLKAVGARVFGITLCAAGVSASVVVDVAQPFGPPCVTYTNTHVHIYTYIHTHRQFMWYDAAFMYSPLRCVTLIRSVSFDCLSLRSLCRCRCRCVAAQLPAALSDPHTHTPGYGCTYFSFSFCLCSPHSLRVMLLIALLAAYGFVRRRCRLRCHSCQCCLPASFHSSSLLPLLLLATSLYGSLADVFASLPFFPFAFVRFVAHFLRFISFLSYPRLSLCLFVHKCISASVCMCVCGGEKTHYYALSGSGRSTRCRWLCCCRCRCRCLCTRR